jgi:hypothetical protein
MYDFDRGRLGSFGSKALFQFSWQGPEPGRQRTFPGSVERVKVTRCGRPAIPHGAAIDGKKRTVINCAGKAANSVAFGLSPLPDALRLHVFVP